MYVQLRDEVHRDVFSNRVYGVHFCTILGYLFCEYSGFKKNFIFRRAKAKLEIDLKMTSSVFSGTIKAVRNNILISMLINGESISCDTKCTVVVNSSSNER